ncbi:HAMP domain-containing histidine kinase [Hyunsoonleella sp. SJ7]|uniref:histidine kinase n=1 Tax=Hyunsoonleella aquatilis TaxID=2762758 RepID=A0A923HDU1_9FLAO|nr:HAMP domain-containing sensor histidine kinase [Hyunsoonleella aquatilis]MBC3758338.1 HAMP domain-containing histidine kinase [Hyunsoonleella aquatilis]
MAYKKYKLALAIRVLVLLLSLIGFAFFIGLLDSETLVSYRALIAGVLLIIAVFSFVNLYRFVFKRFQEMDEFFESVKYRDFSRWFNETSSREDIQELHKGFNEVNKTVLEINKEKEAQHLYLQKILEMVETGIIAYNVKSGDVLWVNEAFKKLINIPSLKNIGFVKNRNATLYEAIFSKKYSDSENITVSIANENTNLLISNSIFEIESNTFKLIALQNIDDTLNKNESEAWKKLLSVMTHEIMNSIAPISSLAETLQSKVELSQQDPDEHPLDIEDLDVGIESIKKRSEGLLKFAKTYRSLNKITKLNLSKIKVDSLFGNIKTLMEPSLEGKNIALLFENENTSLEIEIDTYLIEQVLINLILNAVEACKEVENPSISIKALKNIEGQVVLKIIDNGKGIPEEIMESIFVPFFTTKKTGSGIGLSLCKQIILLHKGKLLVKSKEGEGTVVSLVFLNI